VNHARAGLSVRLRLLYGLLSTLLVLAGVEGLARTFALAPLIDVQFADNVRDPYLPFKRRPNSTHRGRSASNEFNFEYRHNALGFRDRDHESEKPEGVFRIVAVGDSFTYGGGAAEDETYLARLERLLNARPDARTRVEIINLGLPRYFPAVELDVLKHYGWRFQPDLVLVAVLPNDIVDTAVGVDAVVLSESGYLLSKYGEAAGPIGEWLFLHSHAARILLTRGFTWLASSNATLRPDEIYRNGGFHEEAWLALERDLEEMQREARRHHASLVVVSIPQRPPWTDRHEYPAQRLAAWSAAHGAPFIPTLLDLRREESSLLLYWPKDGHCTPAGYGVIARSIFNGLVARQLVP
jgi:lysophospholipase L1-like esterase